MLKQPRAVISAIGDCVQTIGAKKPPRACATRRRPTEGFESAQILRIFGVIQISTQAKLDAKFTSPVPVYLGKVGYSHNGLVRPGTPTVSATT